jgi:UPF0716 family protein affecting phage T7 exclusion
MRSGKITDRVMLRYLRRMERGDDRPWYIIWGILLAAAAGWLFIFGFIWRML